METTIEQIKEHAANVAKEVHGNAPTESRLHFTVGFRTGAEWMQEQLKSDWVPFESMTKEQKIQFNSIDSKRIMVLFDNGDICRFDEEHPFALMVSSYVLPEPLKAV